MSQGYNGKLDADIQISAEEKISAYLFDNFVEGITEEGASEAGRKILLMILSEFRPDLIHVEKKP